MFFEYETERLYLRILKPEAAPKVLDFYLRDKDLFEQFEPARSADFYTVLHHKEILRGEYQLTLRLQAVRFYVIPKSDPHTIIGTISFHNISTLFRSSCEIGYKFSSEYQHQGYATEALKKCTEIIFEDLHLHRIQAWVLPDNLPSQRLLERLGFAREGIARSYLKVNGHWRDHVQYSLISNSESQ